MNVLFDLDGTLTDPRVGIVACLRHALIALRRAVPADDVLASYIGPPLRDTFGVLLGQGSSATDIEAAIAAYRERFSSLGMFENEVHEGIPECLASLASRGARLFVATSKPRVFAQRILEHFDLTAHFDVIYGSELDGRLADKSDLIRHALTSSNLKPYDTVMVGDRLHDVVGALSNGVFPVGVLWGFGSEAELREAGARKLLSATRELADLLPA